MKIRYANKLKNDNIISSNFKYLKIEDDEFSGYISLLNFIEIRYPCYVPRENRKEDCILNNGYYWLQMYPFNSKHAITAMCNENLEIVEWYIDMIDYVSIENDIPYIVDMFLDVVVTNKHEIIVLDQDELDEAFAKGEISKIQYDITMLEAKKVIEKYKNIDEIKKLESFTNKYLNKFLSIMK